MSVRILESQVAQFIPRTHFKWDGRLLRLPLFGELIGKLDVARFSRTLGTLLGNGVPLLTAPSIVKETLTNRVLSAGLDPVADRLKEGQGLAQPLMQAEMFPQLAVHIRADTEPISAPVAHALG